MSEKKKFDREKFNAAVIADPDFKGLPMNQRRMLFALKMQKGNITVAAAMLGIGRQTIYKQCKESAAFKEKFDEIKDMKLDFVENKLMQRIEEGSDALIMFVLSSQGAERGWQSVKKVDHSTNGKDLPASQPQLIFLSADQMTQDQIDKLIAQNESGSSNDIGT